jgi:ribonuclease HII
MRRLEEIPSGSRVAGVDEVGRGCLFGPVFAAAVVLDEVAEQRTMASGANGQQKIVCEAACRIGAAH